MTRPAGHSERPCPVCATPGLRPFVDIGTLPAHIGVLWRDRAAAQSCPRGDISLAVCESCGLVYNLSFDPGRMAYLDEDYDNALDFSSVFSAYAQALARELAERYPLRGGHVIDVGCGKGEFLRTLCRTADAAGLGFDPSAPDSGPGDRVRFRREFYSRAHGGEPADLITCRHVFEHIDDPIPFLAEIRRAIGERATPVYFEVPSLRNILRGNSPWEIIYEHCAYYGEESLQRAFERAGFTVEEIRPMFDDLYLGLWARPGASPAGSGGEGVGQVLELAARFAARFGARVAEWKERVAGWRERGTTAVAWGAGARGTTFVNLLDAADRIPYLVDINPRKHGRFVPGTGQEIVPARRLPELAPDVVIVMNPVYLEEIRSSVAAMGLHPEFLSA